MPLIMTQVFQLIALGGNQLRDKNIFPRRRLRRAYVTTCVTPMRRPGNSSRAASGSGAVRLRVLRSAVRRAGDRSRSLLVKRWGEFAVPTAVVVANNCVPLPEGWENWGTTRKGKPIVERRGDPRNNVGVRTGAAAGLVVIDIDRRAELDGLANLQAQFGSRFNELFPDVLWVPDKVGHASCTIGARRRQSRTPPASCSFQACRHSRRGRFGGPDGSIRGNVRAQRYIIIYVVDVIAAPPGLRLSNFCSRSNRSRVQTSRR